MKGNRFLNPLLMSLLFVSAVEPLYAQSAGPAMLDVKEVLIQSPRFGDTKAADQCGLTREELTGLLEKTLKDNDVPAFSVAEAKPPMLDRARIELMPEIATLNSGGLDCTSWVSLTAQGRASVVIPPVAVARTVTVTYWHDGILLDSDQTTHQRLVGEALEKLARAFAQQYRLDQPPDLPPN